MKEPTDTTTLFEMVQAVLCNWNVPELAYMEKEYEGGIRRQRIFVPETDKTVLITLIDSDNLIRKILYPVPYLH